MSSNDSYEEFDQWPGMKSRWLVLETDTFIVCLDPDLDVDWRTGQEYPGNKDSVAFHKILNRQALLESMPNHDLAEKIRLSFKRMIGEAVARALSHDYANAEKILDNAEQFYVARQGELARSWYLATGGVTTLVIGSAGVVMWLLRQPVKSIVGTLVFWLMMCAIAGAGGAFLSIIMRMGKATLDSAAGKTLHCLECLSRIIAGMIFAVIVALAIHSELILPVYRKIQTPHAFLILFALIGGASERFAPSIIESLEKRGTLSPSEGGKPAKKFIRLKPGQQ
jgi:hypothetical protein